MFLRGIDTSMLTMLKTVYRCQNRMKKPLNGDLKQLPIMKQIDSLKIRNNLGRSQHVLNRKALGVVNPG